MNNNKIFNIVCIVIVLIGFTSCGLDNYDPPKSKLIGDVIYKDSTIGLKGSYGAIQFQLYQDGYQLNTPISVFVDQNGHFESDLFDGTYKLVTRDKNGPWVNSRDTTVIKVKGNTVIKFNVTPFFTVSDANIVLNGNNVVGSCNIAQIVPDSKIDWITLFIGRTSFVDENINISSVKDVNPQVGNVSLLLNLSIITGYDLSKETALFARIGVKTISADQAIYSRVVRLK